MSFTLVFAALGLALTAGPALAHPPPLDIGGFPGGLLHPLFVPAHLMAIVAVALLAGQQAHWTRMVAVAFAFGLAGGLSVMTLGVVPTLVNEIVLGCALFAGLAVALARPLPEWLGCALAVVAAFCLALDSPPEAISLTEANLMLLGTGLGALGTMVAVSEAARRLRRPRSRTGWPRIAARVLGSWIAASAILVLVLRFAR